jgi:coenzyme F420 hydrogenase subunit beta
MTKKAENKTQATQNKTKTEISGSLGAYSEVFSAKSDIDGQDGGIVSAMLIGGIKKGLFNAVVVVKRKEGYHAKAAIAKNADEVMAARKTEYLKVKTAQKLQELTARGEKKIAVVCTPCEAHTARQMLQTLKHDYPDVEVTVIGLFCFEAFNYDKLKQETKRIMDINIDEAEKTLIQKGKFLVQIKEKNYSCDVKNLGKATEAGCRYCSDFPAWSADISFGSAGSQSGYSTVIVRSEAGKKLLENLEIQKTEAKKEEIQRLAKLKEERARRNFASLQSQQQPSAGHKIV